MPARPMKERRREDQRDSGAPTRGVVDGWRSPSPPPLSLCLFLQLRVSDEKGGAEGKRNLAFCNPEIHSSHSVSPWSVLERYGSKEMGEMVVGGCLCVHARAQVCSAYLLTQSSPTEGKLHSVGVSVLFPWQNLFALCHWTINHATAGS